MRQTICEHPKGLPKGYPFDLHSQIRNPNRVSIKGEGRILLEEEKKGETAAKEKNPRKLDGYCSEKTLVIFHRKIASSSTSDWRSVRVCGSRRFISKKSCLKNKLQRWAFLLIYFEATVLHLERGWENGWGRENGSVFLRKMNKSFVVCVTFLRFLFFYLFLKAFKTYLKPTYRLAFPCIFFINYCLLTLMMIKFCYPHPTARRLGLLFGIPSPFLWALVAH